MTKQSLEIDLPIAIAVERLTHGARLRSGAAWPAARSAVFSLGACSIGCEAQEIGDRTLLSWELEAGCENFAPFAEQELRVIMGDEAAQARKRWGWLLGIGVGCLVAVLFLAR